MHIPVLLQESLQGLNLSPGKIVVDATVNGGGHTEAIVKAWGKDVRVIGIDLDAKAIARSKKRMGKSGIVDLVCDSYINVDKVINTFSISKVDAVLFDFGLSSDQFESGRGFSFQKDEPLLMTFKDSPDTSDVTARDVVNSWERESLETVIFGFGEERYAKRIARAIVEARDVKPIETTFELVEVIKSAVPAAYRSGRRIHPATRTFQAIRIAVNGELQSIELGLRAAFSVLSHGGRICAISFHSLEDRIVKKFFKSCAEQDIARLVTKKPIVPGRDEEHANPRSRSAKLRILEKI